MRSLTGIIFEKWDPENWDDSDQIEIDIFDDFQEEKFNPESIILDFYKFMQDSGLKLKDFFTLEELIEILPNSLKHKFTIDEYPLIQWLFQEVMDFIENLALENGSITSLKKEDQNELNNFVNKYYLKYCWSFDSMKKLLQIGFVNQRIFVFALGECEAISNLITFLSESHLTKEENVVQIFKLLSKSKIIMSNKMIQDFINEGLNPSIALQENPFMNIDFDSDYPLGDFNQELQKQEVNLAFLNHMIKAADSQAAMISQVLSIVDMITFEKILLHCQKWEVVELLALMFSLKQKSDHIKRFFKVNDTVIKELLGNLHQDVNSFFRSIQIFLNNEPFLHEYRTDINRNNTHFIQSYSKLESEIDTPEKVFSRSIYLVDILLTQYQPFVEKMDDYDFKITPLRRHLFEVSSRLTELLVKQIVYVDLSKEEEYIDLEMENLDLIESLHQTTDPGIELASNPDYVPGYVQPTRPDKKDQKIRIDRIDLFEKAHEIYNLSDSLKWSDRLITEFTLIFEKLIEMNLGTNKLYAVAGKIYSEKIDMFKLLDAQTGEFRAWNSLLWKGIYNLAIGGIIHGDTISLLQENILNKKIAHLYDIDEFWWIGFQRSKNIQNIIHNDVLKERAYAGASMLILMSSNQRYEKKYWDVLKEHLIPPVAIENIHSQLNANLNGQIVQSLLLTNFEGAKQKVSTSEYISVFPKLIEQSKQEYDIFKPTPYSEKLGELLRYDYYDFMYKNEVIEFVKVHYVQKQVILLCLSERHNSGFTMKLRGDVNIAIRLLTYLKYTVRVINKMKLIQMSKRRERLNHINQILRGLEKNHKRQFEDDHTYFFNY